MLQSVIIGHKNKRRKYISFMGGANFFVLFNLFSTIIWLKKNIISMIIPKNIDGRSRNEMPPTANTPTMHAFTTSQCRCTQVVSDTTHIGDTRTQKNTQMWHRERSCTRKSPPFRISPPVGHCRSQGLVLTGEGYHSPSWSPSGVIAAYADHR